MKMLGAVSNDLLVAEEVFQVPDLQVGRHEHHQDGNDPKRDNSALYLLILGLEALLADDQHGQFRSQLLDHVLDFLGLELNWAQVLLRHYVSVVRRLDSGLQGESIIDCAVFFTLTEVLDANLVVARVVRGEMVPHLLLLVQRLQLLALWVNDGQDELLTV